MTIATALLLTALCAATDQELTRGPDPTTDPSSGRQQPASGVIIAADIHGRLVIYDSEHRVVVEVDKLAGGQLQVALAPGAYEARLGPHGSRRMRFQVAEGQQRVIDLAGFESQAAGPPPAAPAPPRPAPPYRAEPLDARHRVEMRIGAWGDGWFDHDQDWHSSGTVHGALAVEYLNFVTSDVGIGIGVSSLVRAHGHDWDWTDRGAAQVTTTIPVSARWYPIRRLTRSRSVEPYVTGGVGVVFGVDTVYTDIHDDWHGDVDRTHVGTAFGGRLGGGMDIRLGSIFTLGVAGAWNWDTGFPSDMWSDGRPSGGEFTLVLGWNFGR